MSKKVIGRLTAQALDELDKIERLQELLNIGLEQVEEPYDIRVRRVELLLVIYVKDIEPHFDDLKLALERLRQLIRQSPTEEGETP